MHQSDPTEFDDAKIRVPDFQRKTYLDGTKMFAFGTKIVPAKLVEQVCPHCGGTGTVKVKVELENK